MLAVIYNVFTGNKKACVIPSLAVVPTISKLNKGTFTPVFIFLFIFLSMAWFCDQGIWGCSLRCVVLEFKETKLKMTRYVQKLLDCLKKQFVVQVY